MSDMRMKYDEDLKTNIVKLSSASNKSFRATAADLEIGEGLLYRWRK